MKEEINLLPPSAKRARLRRVSSRHIGYLIRRLAAGLLLCLSALTGAYVIAWTELRHLTNQLGNGEGTEEKVVQQVFEVNQIMQAIDTRIHEHIPWTPLARDVIELLPQEARLELLEVRADRDALKVEGVALARAAILDMQRKLETLSWVTRLEAPLQNFAAGERTEFSFVLFRGEEGDETTE